MRLHGTETTEEKEARALHIKLHARLLEQIAGADDFVTPLIDGDVKLTDIFFASSGAAVVYDDGFKRRCEVRTVGVAPSPDAVSQLAAFCRLHLIDGVYASDCISADVPEFEAYTSEASGVLAISVGEHAQHMILWFRPEVVRTTIWGGATPSAVEEEKLGGNYYPRTSFERWAVEKRGHSRPWPEWKISIAKSLRTALNDVILRQLRTIRSLNERLVESDQAKSRFLAHMSHELRTPMNAILGFSEAMILGIYGGLTEKQLETTELINQSAMHLLSMINDILDLSKIEAGRMELSAEELDAAVTIRQAVELTGSLGMDAGVAVVIDLPENLPNLETDRRALLQMIINLLSNAIKFTPAGGTVTAKASLEHDGSMKVSVIDTGEGIPEDMLLQVIEPFRQAERNMEIARQGTGLGLALVKHLIEEQGGTLSLQSTVGVGTSATLTFPASQVLGDLS